MSEPQQHGRHRLPVVVVAVVLLLAGATLVVGALRNQQHAPQPPAAAATNTGARSTAGAATANAATPRSAPPSGPALPAAVPVRLSIPAIGVATDLLQLGLNPDHTVQVPPLGQHSEAGWYRYSPTPGQLGPSIILGHVDSAEYGAAVFFRLGALRPGDLANVIRADHTVAVFRVDRVVSYAKSRFPTLEVYGNTRTAALRLITCGGKFDFSTRNYESNIVVYASLVASHAA